MYLPDLSGTAFQAPELRKKHVEDVFFRSLSLANATELREKETRQIFLSNRRFGCESRIGTPKMACPGKWTHGRTSRPISWWFSFDLCRFVRNLSFKNALSLNTHSEKTRAPTICVLFLNPSPPKTPAPRGLLSGAAEAAAAPAVRAAGAHLRGALQRQAGHARQAVWAEASTWLWVKMSHHQDKHRFWS